MMEKNNLTKEGVLQYIKEHDYTSMVELQRRFERTEGNVCFGLLEKNVYFWMGMSKEFYIIIKELIKEGFIYYKPADVLTYLLGGGGLRLPIVKSNTSIDNISKLINRLNGAVLVELEDNNFHIITKYDVINAIR